jgi:hypothetical protein
MVNDMILTKTNEKVLKFYRKASSETKKHMRDILKIQIDNLNELMRIMEVEK